MPQYADSKNVIEGDYHASWIASMKETELAQVADPPMDAADAKKEVESTQVADPPIDPADANVMQKVNTFQSLIDEQTPAPRTRAESSSGSAPMRSGSAPPTVYRGEVKNMRNGKSEMINLLAHEGDVGPDVAATDALDLEIDVLEEYEFKMKRKFSWVNWRIVLIMCTVFGAFIGGGFSYGVAGRHLSFINTFYLVTGAITGSGSTASFGEDLDGSKLDDWNVAFGAFYITIGFVLMSGTLAFLIDYVHYAMTHRSSKNRDVLKSLLKNELRLLQDHLDFDQEISSLRWTFIKASAFVVGATTICAVGYKSTTPYSYWHAFYFVAQTLTTCGYGDVSPDGPYSALYGAILNLFCGFIIIPAFITCIMVPFRIQDTKERRLIFEQFGDHLTEHNFKMLCKDPLLNALRSNRQQGKMEIQRGNFALWYILFLHKLLLLNQFVLNNYFESCNGRQTFRSF